MSEKKVLDKEKVKVRRTGTSDAITIPKRKSLIDYFKAFRKAGELEVSVVRDETGIYLEVRKVES